MGFRSLPWIQLSICEPMTSTEVGIDSPSSTSMEVNVTSMEVSVASMEVKVSEKLESWGMSRVTIRYSLFAISLPCSGRVGLGEMSLYISHHAVRFKAIISYVTNAEYVCMRSVFGQTGRICQTLDVNQA